jgi:hypothetical protein
MIIWNLKYRNIKTQKPTATATKKLEREKLRSLEEKSEAKIELHDH